jgi:hypothetical protein
LYDPCVAAAVMRKPQRDLLKRSAVATVCDNDKALGLPPSLGCRIPAAFGQKPNNRPV